MSVSRPILRCLRPFHSTRWRTYSSNNNPISKPITKLTFNFFSSATILASMSHQHPQSAGAIDSFPSESYRPKYDTWPYTPSDFSRCDPSPDSIFYSQPRLVTHIDDPAISRLTRYYDAVLPTQGKVLDMCTSWKSFYPRSMKDGVQKGELEVYGVGLNAEEMKLNGMFAGKEQRWRVLDLNVEPWNVRAGWEAGNELLFEAVTCVVSIDYLTEPLKICRNLLDAVKDGGTVHFVISNRCFPNKVVRRWMMLDERGRLEFVGDYLHFSGWKDVEIVDLCARDEEGKRITDDRGTFTASSNRLPSHLDPLWVVRATKRV